MYLTRIVLNLEDRLARSDLASPYELHSTLSRAFLSTPGAEEKPAPFLWRQEVARNAPMLLVQSGTQPNWQAVRDRARNWAGDIMTKTIDLQRLSQKGSTLRFRLRCNPTVNRQGKRHGLWKEDEQLAWLARQADRCGFSLLEAAVSNPERVSVSRRKSSSSVVVHAVTFDGNLRVSEQEPFLSALREGIGHAKFLGLGLLSVAPAER